MGSQPPLSSHDEDPLEDLFPREGGTYFKPRGRQPRTEPTPGLNAGKRVGDYELIELLGQGGMGQVWAARQISLERRVALKFVHPERVTPKLVELLQREARAGGRLRHPAIVTVYAHGQDDGFAWIAMELVEEATTLRDWLDELRLENVVPEGHDTRVAALVAQIAEAMEAAHRAAVIHRDLKPQNILIGADDRPRVTDFGLARITDESALSQSGDIAGTYAYMSPEQIAASRTGIDHRTDVFSLGVVLYELLSFRRPFEGDTPQQITSKIETVEPLDLRTLRSRIPGDLAVIVAKALEKERSKRFDSMKEFAADLRRFLAHEPIHARPVTRLGRTLRWIRRNRGTCVTSALGLLIATLATSFLVQGARLRRVEAANHASTFAYALREISDARYSQSSVNEVSEKPVALEPGSRLVAARAGSSRNDVDYLESVRKLAGQLSSYSLALDGTVDPEDWMRRFFSAIPSDTRTLLLSVLYDCAIDVFGLRQQTIPSQSEVLIDKSVLSELLQRLDGGSARHSLWLAYSTGGGATSDVLAEWTHSSRSGEELAWAGDLEWSVGRRGSAEHLYLQAVLADPSIFQAQTRLGHLNSARGDASAALSYYRVALALAPKSSFALINVSTQLKQPSQRAEAERLLRRAIQLSPRNGRAYVNLALVLTRPEGEQLLRAAVNTVDLDPNLFVNLSFFEMERGDHTGAIATAERGLIHFPNHPELLLQIAQASMWRKDAEIEVFDAFRRAADAGLLRAGYPPAAIVHAAINASGSALEIAATFDDTEHGWCDWNELALQYATAARGLAPGHPVAIVNAASALFNLSRIDEALDLVEFGIGLEDHAGCVALVRVVREQLPSDPLSGHPSAEMWLRRMDTLLSAAQ